MLAKTPTASTLTAKERLKTADEELDLILASNYTKGLVNHMELLNILKEKITDEKIAKAQKESEEWGPLYNRFIENPNKIDPDYKFVDGVIWIKNNGEHHSAGWLRFFLDLQVSSVNHRK